MRKRLAVALAAFACAAFGAPAAAGADTIGPIGFDDYSVGNINGQNGWQKTGPYDVEIENVADFAAASGYGFGTKALRLSNSTTSGSFGDQTFSPALLKDAGEAAASDGGGLSNGVHQSHFEVEFNIGTALAAPQPGLAVTMSPDRGDGARMSFLRFEQGVDGIHVVFFDVDNPGPVGTVSSFEPHDVATITRGEQHAIRLEMEFVDGPGNDVVEVFVDGALVHTGTSWEDYHRFDPEAAGNGNKVPTVDSALFRLSGTAAPATTGQGFLIDGFRLASSTPTAATPTPASDTAGQVGGKKKCKKAKKGADAAKKKKCRRRRSNEPSQQRVARAGSPIGGPALCSGAILGSPRPPGRGFFTSGCSFGTARRRLSEAEETWPQTCESV